MRQLFFEIIRPQVRPFLEQLLPDGNLYFSIQDMFVGMRQKKSLPKKIDQFTDNQIEQVIAYLYGIYFYNLISGGRIMSHDLNYGQTKKAEAKVRGFMPATITDESEKYMFIRENASGALESNTLVDWPLKASPSMLDSQVMASANTQFNSINIILEKFADINPDETKQVLVRKGKGVLRKGKTTYSISYREKWILVGIEEASHIDFAKLRKMRYEGFSGKSSVFATKADYYHGPLATHKSRQTVLHDMDYGNNPEARIDYYALLAEEFASHIVQASYTELYNPNTWNAGYKDYDKIVRERRRQFQDGE